VQDFCWWLDETSVRSTPATAEDGESSCSESELNDDDVDDDRFYNEQQNDANNDDEDEAEADAAYDSEQLEADIMTQLGLYTWLSVAHSHKMCSWYAFFQ